MTMVERMRSKSLLQILVRKMLWQIRALCTAHRGKWNFIDAIGIFRIPLEPILHPSVWRLKWLGIFTLIGHSLFALLWNLTYPQPYDSMSLRFCVGLLGIPLVTDWLSRDLESSVTKQVTSLILWISLPLFFFFMLFRNDGTTLWWASCCCMVLIYYHLTDWRLATIGTTSGLCLAWLIDQSVRPLSLHSYATDFSQNAIVFGFAWFSAVLLGASSANLRREHVKHTLSTIGIMAHELRTPLATVAMVADVLIKEAKGVTDQVNPLESGLKIDRMGSRLHALTRQMHHQIDTQIANARLLQLPVNEERISAYELLNDAIGRYPYRTLRERTCVELNIHRDFIFLSSFSLFSQVIDNMMNNAFHALTATDRLLSHGDLRIDATLDQNRGVIAISDRGQGVRAHLLPRIFEPFFSTHRGMGHGLGLAFCQQVVNSAKGTISVESTWMSGTRFLISVPLAGNVQAIQTSAQEKMA